MHLPREQPRRAIVAVLIWAALGSAGAVVLVQLHGPFLGGVFAIMLLEALAVPTAVVAFHKERDSA